ncbi:MAG TPA: hypothetical protein ENI79_01730 [Rhodospirillales bacterium]|nr:hypothetical protein [Rhodospirillales bacterium]
MSVIVFPSVNLDDLDEIEEVVAAGLEFEDRFVRKAFAKFLDRHREALGEPVDEDEVIGPVTSNEVKESIIAAWIADVRHTAAQMVVEVRDAALDVAATQMKLAILEHEDVDPDNAPVPDLHRFLLKKRPKEEDDEEDSEEVLEDYRKRLAFIGALAKGVEPEVLEGLKQGQVPDQFTGEDGFKTLLSDLAEFLVEHGEDGFNQVGAIVEDADVALKVVKDDDASGPVRFIAYMRLKIHDAEKVKN